MIKMNERLYARMVKMLFDGCTPQNICAETGLHIVTAQSYLRALHDVGAVHISGWVKNSRGADATKIYTLGVGEDKPRFKLTRSEIARRYKFKKKLRKKMEREQSILNQADLSSLDLAMARLTVPVMTLAWKTPRRL